MIGIVSQKPDDSSVALPAPVSADDWIKGSPAAKAVLVEYSDFQCPACKYFFSQVKQLESDFGDKIAFVYRYFPLEAIHKYALLSAQAAEAAGKQGKFWEMHDLIFQNQEQWADSGNALDNFVSYAQTLNLDVDKFKSDINSPEITDKIKKMEQSALAADLKGTPTFFLNGNQISPQSYGEFKQLIENELNK